MLVTLAAYLNFGRVNLILWLLDRPHAVSLLKRVFGPKLLTRFGLRLELSARDHLLWRLHNHNRLLLVGYDVVA